jgi:hypothetical protein
MKRHLFLLATGLALVVAPQAATAQQSAKVQYRSSIYVNVPQEKIPAFLDNQRTVVKKVMQERINSGENLESWALLSLLYRGSPALEYNYVSTAVFSGPPPEPNPTARDQVIKKATGGTYSEYMQKLNSTSTVTGSVLTRVDGAAPGSQMKEGNVINVVRWKIEPNRGAEYDAHLKMLVAVQSQAVKEGQYLGWAAGRVVSPAGANAPYDAVTSFILKDLASALQRPGGAFSNQAIFAKLFPQASYMNYVDQGRAVRRVVRTELFRVMSVVERPATATTSSR